MPPRLFSPRWSLSLRSFAPPAPAPCRRRSRLAFLFYRLRRRGRPAGLHLAKPSARRVDRVSSRWWNAVRRGPWGQSAASRHRDQPTPQGDPPRQPVEPAEGPLSFLSRAPQPPWQPVEPARDRLSFVESPGPADERSDLLTGRGRRGFGRDDRVVALASRGQDEAHERGGHEHHQYGRESEGAQASVRPRRRLSRARLHIDFKRRLAREPRQRPSGTPMPGIPRFVARRAAHARYFSAL